MVEVTVECLVRHNSQHEIERNQDEWTAVHIKKIVKGEDLHPRARFRFPINGVIKEITNANRALFIEALPKLMARKIAADCGVGVAIVPIPNGDGVVGSIEPFRTLRIARRIAGHIEDAQAIDLLRWKKAQGKAHLKEKQRDVFQYRQNLQICGETDRKVVLFDDVVTTGSQMAAAKGVLEDAGFEVVGCFAVIEVIEKDQRGDKYGWKSIKRNPCDIQDIFAGLNF